MKALSLASLCLALACGSSSTPTATPTPSEGEAEPQGGAAPQVTCEEATDCGTCMAVAGCNWTPHGCSDACLMDTWCVTPGNACPAVPVGFLGAWQEDQSRRTDSARVFVSAEQDLGPSRFRQTYAFRADGTADIGVLAPDDAHYSATGTWTLAPGPEIHVVYETREGEQRAESWTAAVSEGTLTLTTNPVPGW